LKRTPEHALSEDNRSGERVPETTELKAEPAQCSTVKDQDQTSHSL
jgi:hypothetical protein